MENREVAQLPGLCDFLNRFHFSLFPPVAALPGCWQQTPPGEAALGPAEAAAAGPRPPPSVLYGVRACRGARGREAQASGPAPGRGVKHPPRAGRAAEPAAWAAPRAPCGAAGGGEAARSRCGAGCSAPAPPGLTQSPPPRGTESRSLEGRPRLLPAGSAVSGARWSRSAWGRGCRSGERGTGAEPAPRTQHPAASDQVCAVCPRGRWHSRSISELDTVLQTLSPLILPATPRGRNCVNTQAGN